MKTRVIALALAVCMVLGLGVFALAAVNGPYACNCVYSQPSYTYGTNCHGSYVYCINCGVYVVGAPCTGNDH